MVNGSLFVIKLVWVYCIVVIQGQSLLLLPLLLIFRVVYDIQAG